MKTLSEEQKNNWAILYDTVQTLSNSQGFYGRLLNKLNSLDVNEIIEITAKLPKFKDPVDVILYFES